MTHAERLEFLRQQPEETISPVTLTKIIGGDPYAYNVAAKAGMLSLPHIWRGRNLRIFVAPLLELLGGNRIVETYAFGHHTNTQNG